jgi:uncharacterized protein
VYTVRLTRVPEDGAAKETDVRLSLDDLALGAPFDAAGVRLSWELTRMMGKVYGKVRAGSGLTLTCSRCLKDFASSVETDFAVLFEPRPRVERGAQDRGGVVDLDDDAGPSVVFFDGEELPLGEEVRQELELAVPFHSLCRERCAGLCARCGADLNEGACACPDP